MTCHYWQPIFPFRIQAGQLLILKEIYLHLILQWPGRSGTGFRFQGFPLGGSKIDSVFHSSKVDKMSTTNPWELLVKRKLSPHSGFVALRQWNYIHKNGPQSFPF